MAVITVVDIVVIVMMEDMAADVATVIMVAADAVMVTMVAAADVATATTVAVDVTTIKKRKVRRNS